MRRPRGGQDAQAIQLVQARTLEQVQQKAGAMQVVQLENPRQGGSCCSRADSSNSSNSGGQVEANRTSRGAFHRPQEGSGLQWPQSSKGAVGCIKGEGDLTVTFQAGVVLSQPRRQRQIEEA